MNGSPRPSGNTSRLVSSILDAMPDNVETNVVSLYGMDISGCRNCGACQKRTVEGHCAMRDDMSGLYEGFLEADVVILASPIYMWQFTTCMNAFMSRLHCLFRDGGEYNPMKGKRIAVAMTMGDDEYVAGFAVGALMDFCEYFQLRYSGAVAVPFANAEQIDRPIYKEKVKDFVSKLF